MVVGVDVSLQIDYPFICVECRGGDLEAVRVEALVIISTWYPNFEVETGEIKS